jgi:hypothetical protein
MMYNTQNPWVSTLCPSSCILKTRKQHLKNWICFRPQVEGGRHLLFLTDPTGHVSFASAEKGKRYSFRNVFWFYFRISNDD